MPVDKMITDAMLGSFRTMWNECKENATDQVLLKDLSAILSRMETLAEETDDVSVFSAILAQENLFMQFSEKYSALLATGQQQAAPQAYGEKEDKQLLAQTLKAYQDAADRITAETEKAKKTPGNYANDTLLFFNEQKLLDALNNIIVLGSTAGSYPLFLTALIQKGYDKVLEGSLTDRNNLLFSLDAAKAEADNPFAIQKEEEKLNLFDKLSTASPFGVPDNLLFTLAAEKIDWEYEPEIRRWKKIKEGWRRSLSWLDEWITSWCPFAASIEPWSAARNPAAAVIQSQQCVPGMLRAWEKINKRYFNLDVQALCRHASFSWDQEKCHLAFSDEYSQFLIEQVEPACQPFKQPSPALIEQAAIMHRQQRVVNPNRGLPAQRYAAFFDSYFGKGEFVKRYGLTDQTEKA